MEKLVYFRMIYEYEKHHNVLQRMKEYIHGSNSSAIQDLCAGNLHLPSPFLLDELEWSLDIRDHKVRQIIYQLKITSREFYLSLIEFKYGSYRKHFDDTSASFGKKMICNLRELRIFHAANSQSMLDKFNMIFSKISIFSSLYPNMFRVGYALFTGWACISGWSLGSSLELYNDSAATTLLLPSIMGSITAIGAFTLEQKINVFERLDITGKNLLAIRYREFVVRLKSRVVL